MWSSLFKVSLALFFAIHASDASIELTITPVEELNGKEQFQTVVKFEWNGGKASIDRAEAIVKGFDEVKPQDHNILYICLDPDIKYSQEKLDNIRDELTKINKTVVYLTAYYENAVLSPITYMYRVFVGEYGLFNKSVFDALYGASLEKWGINGFVFTFLTNQSLAASLVDVQTNLKPIYNILNDGSRKWYFVRSKDDLKGLVRADGDQFNFSTWLINRRQ